jgi:hypothetical protein
MSSGFLCFSYCCVIITCARSDFINNVMVGISPRLFLAVD